MNKSRKETITLVFDTCLDKMYVALLSDDKILSSKTVENHDKKYHSAFLISTIKEILKENRLTPEDINLIGTNIGPGSFTGIRACTTVARIMGQLLKCKTIGVSSLEILAELSPQTRIVALDARKDKAYLYYNDEIKGAVPLEEVRQMCKDKKIITDNKLKPMFEGISYQGTGADLGKILAKLTLQKAKTADGDWQKLKPLYIQPPPMG